MKKKPAVPAVHFEVTLENNVNIDDVKQELESLDKDLTIKISRLRHVTLVEGFAPQDVYERIFHAKIDYKNLTEGNVSFQDWRESVCATVPASLKGKIQKIKLIEMHNVLAV